MDAPEEWWCSPVDDGIARVRWMERSEEPVRRYVPGLLENVIALIGPVEVVSSFNLCRGMVFESERVVYLILPLCVFRL